jgi:serine protease
LAPLRLAHSPLRRIAHALAGVALACVALAADAQPLRPRIPAEKPARTRLSRGDDPSRIVVKFAEGSPLRTRALAQRALREAGVPLRALRRAFSLPEHELDRLREQGQRRSARVLADLNLYFELTLPPGLDTAALCDALNALPGVELALPARTPAPPPVDLAPPTPSFASGQGYREAAPGGVGAILASSIPGASGAGVRLVDVEYRWVLDHEDLELAAAANIDSATLSDPFPADEGSHGTAVLGVLRGRHNGYGVLGLANAASVFVAPANTVQHGYDPVRAIGLALGVLAPGDVLLLEQQTWACGGLLGPLESYPPWFDAIANATAQGVVVIEPAGNGSIDLDGPACGGWFDRSVRDSGAILVGAGSAISHTRMYFSSYGSRVDVQGWGQNVATTGYGDLFDPADARQRYTDAFSGTSSASAVVAGAAIAVQGALLAHGFAPLDAFEMRTLLVGTGTPQGGTQHIGPLPNIAGALAALGIHAAPPSSCGLGGAELVLLLIWLGKRRRQV